MATKTELINSIHKRAVDIVGRYRTCEVDLIEILELAERFGVHTANKYSSLFVYATRGLGLSEEVAYIFINVARKVREVPALKAEIAKGTITVSKAKRITSVLNQDNQKHWLTLAAQSTKREVERAVAAENPKATVAEKATFVSGDRMQLQVGVSDKFMLRLRRAQDVVSQKRQRSVNLEQTLNVILDQFLEREDPVEIAKRQLIKGRLVQTEFSPGNLNPVVGTSSVVGTNSVGNRKPGVDTDSVGNSNSVGKINRMKENVNLETKATLNAPDLIKTTASEDKPVAKSATGPGPSRSTNNRRPIRAATRHKLNIKFNGQCAFEYENGERCPQRRFLDIHHVKHLSEGGTNDIGNLELLCSGHHKIRHRI